MALRTGDAEPSILGRSADDDTHANGGGGKTQARLPPAQVRNQLNQSSSPVRMSPAHMRAKLVAERGDGGGDGDGIVPDNAGGYTPEVVIKPKARRG